jgi:hypothetical protein
MTFIRRNLEKNINHFIDNYNRCFIINIMSVPGSGGRPGFSYNY